MDIKNPATSKLITSIKEDNIETLTSKFELLYKNKNKCSNQPLKKRLEIISTFKKLLSKNKNELALILTNEMGKPLFESKNEIDAAILRIEYFINESEKWITKRIIHQDGNTSEVLSYEPLGVLLNISAWNYPYLVGMNVIIPAIIGGNTLMYKPSEFATMTGQKIAELLYQSGLSQSFFQIAIGDGAIGKELLKLRFNGVYFTGSFKTGHSIYMKLANKMIPVGLELGGKDPCYVSDSIKDISQIANLVCEGAFYNNGQSCCSVERIYVHEKIYSEFIKYFKLAISNLKIGNPLTQDNNQGALARTSHINYLNEQIQDALNQGAEILIQNNNIPSIGSFFPPTVLINVNHEMQIMKEETFGPLIGIQKVKNDQEAIKLMDDSDYGLTASIFCNNDIRSKEILAHIDAGNVYINCCDRVSPYLPWAGQRNSGIGLTLSFQGILSFVKPKSYHIREL